MKHRCVLFLSGISTLASAQLINGSFESDGAFDLTGWTATCPSPFFGPGHPDWGDFGVSVPHGENNGCSGSFLYQLVPAIHDGATWNLTGWCFNFLYNISDPYIGIRMGVKFADGSFSYNTPALMSSGNWTHLSVTNTFSLSTGDTAYVMCDAGTVSGMGLGAYAVFDGLVLSDLSTGISATAAPMPTWRYAAESDELVLPHVDPSRDRLLLSDAMGRCIAWPVARNHQHTVRLSTASLPAGIFVISDGSHSLRFVKP